jgi:hypothetical protein
MEVTMEANMSELTQKRLQELLRYDPSTGDFYWKVQTNPRALVGAKAGANSISLGYRSINLDKKTYKAHNLVWFYFHGTFPSNVIDHTNGIRLDNRIENLRDVSQQQNTWNLQGAKRNNKCGYLGVDWKPERKKWRAQIRMNQKKQLLGYFDTAEEASAAYQLAKQKRDTQ